MEDKRREATQARRGGGDEQEERFLWLQEGAAVLDAQLSARPVKYNHSQEECCLFSFSSRETRVTQTVFYCANQKNLTTLFFKKTFLKMKLKVARLYFGGMVTAGPPGREKR